MIPTKSSVSYQPACMIDVTCRYRSTSSPQVPLVRINLRRIATRKASRIPGAVFFSTLRPRSRASFPRAQVWGVERSGATEASEVITKGGSRHPLPGTGELQSRSQTTSRECHRFLWVLSYRFPGHGNSLLCPRLASKLQKDQGPC